VQDVHAAGDSRYRLAPSIATSGSPSDLVAGTIGAAVYLGRAFRFRVIDLRAPATRCSGLPT